MLLLQASLLSLERRDTVCEFSSLGRLVLKGLVYPSKGLALLELRVLEGLRLIFFVSKLRLERLYLLVQLFRLKLSFCL